MRVIERHCKFKTIAIILTWTIRVLTVQFLNMWLLVDTVGLSLKIMYLTVYQLLRCMSYELLTLHRFVWNKHVKLTFVTVDDGDSAAAAADVSQDDREHESSALVSEFVSQSLAPACRTGRDICTFIQIDIAQ